MLYQRGPETLIVDPLSPTTGVQPCALCPLGPRTVLPNSTDTGSRQVKHSFEEPVDFANPSPKTAAICNRADEPIAGSADSMSQSELEKSAPTLYYSPIFFKQKHPHPTQVVVG